jgi:hypothetical protein
MRYRRGIQKQPNDRIIITSTKQWPRVREDPGQFFGAPGRARSLGVKVPYTPDMGKC